MPISSSVSARQKPNAWHVAPLKVKPKYLAMVAKMAKQPDKDVYYIRDADDDAIYTATVNPNVSTQFKDWVETDLMKALRDRIQPLVYVNVPGWMLPIGAWFLRTEAELVLKSRRVVPTRALQLGYRFHHATIGTALDDLLRNNRTQQH